MRLFRKYISGIMLLFCLNSVANGIKEFTGIEGLPTNDVLDIIKDPYGFIWIAHDSGVLRYDGYEFVEYNIKEGNPYKIQLEAVWKLYLDAGGRLWISGGNNGCARYDYASEKFTHYRYVEGNENVRLMHVKDIDEDSKGRIWMGGAEGIYWYDEEKDWVSKANPISVDNDPVGVVHSILIDSDDILWCGTGNLNLFRMDISKNLLARYKKGRFEQYQYVRKPITGITQDSNGWLWILGESVTVKINPQTNEQKDYDHLMLNPNKSSWAIEDDKGNMWISAGGINIFNIENEKVEYYESDISFDNTISSNVTTKVYKDDQGVFWIGSWYGGVDVYKSLKNPIWHIKSLPCVENGLSHNLVHCFYEDHDGTIWIGCEDGILNNYDPKTRVFKHYEDSQMEINEAITGVVESDDHQYLYLGTWGALKKFNKATGEFLRIEEDILIPSLIKGPNHKVWFGISNGGLCEYDLSTGNLKVHSDPALGSCYQQVDFFRHLHLDNFGNVWVVAWAGLVKYNLKEKCFYKIVQDNQVPFSLPEGQVYCCFQDSKSRLWVGNTKGLSLYNYQRNYFMNFGEKYGLGGTEVKSILEDQEGNLWLTTDKGITKFILPAVVNSIAKDSLFLEELPDDFVYFQNFDREDGVQDGKFMKGVLYASDGTMYFGGTEGVNAFKPQDILEDTLQSPVRFIEFKLFNNVVRPQTNEDDPSPLKESIALTEQIVLNHKQYIFSIKWASLNYYATKKVEYAYIMDGFDTEWNFVGNNRLASYTGLPAGEYTFRVKSTNGDGKWNQEEAMMRFVILPPWWDTWLFKGVFAITVLVLIVFLSYRKVNQLERQKKILQKKVDESVKGLKEANATKDKFLSIVAHDLRNPFQSLLGYSELLIEYDSDYRAKERMEIYNRINNVSKKTLNLLENLLNWSMAQSGKVQYDPEKIEVEQYINRNILFLKSSAEKKEIQLKSQVDNGLYVYSDSNTSDTILRNLISNAIKFTGRGGTITVSARLQESDAKMVLLTVKDNGIGMTKEMADSIFKIDKEITTLGTEKQKGTGLGLSLCVEFVKLNKGTIWVESEEGLGSSFIFSLPIAES